MTTRKSEMNSKGNGVYNPITRNGKSLFYDIYENTNYKELPDEKIPYSYRQH